MEPDQIGGGSAATASTAKQLLLNGPSPQPASARDLLARADTESQAKARAIQDMAAMQALRTGKPVPRDDGTNTSNNPYKGAMRTTATALALPGKIIWDTVEGINRFGQTAISPITGEKPSIDLNSEEGVAEVVLTGAGAGGGAPLAVRGAVGGKIKPHITSAGGADDAFPTPKAREVIDYDLRRLTNDEYDYSDKINPTGQVIKNPTKADLARLQVIPLDQRQPGGLTKATVRAIEDADGNVYAWNGYSAIHYEIEQYLKSITDGKFKSSSEYYVEFGKDGKPYMYNEPEHGSVEDFGKPYDPSQGRKGSWMKSDEGIPKPIKLTGSKIKYDNNKLLEDLDSLGGTPNPLNSRETVLGDAVVEARIFNDSLHVSSIRAIKPGGGKAAMQKLVDIADREGIAMDLDALPFQTYGNKMMTEDQLIKWYEQFGFVHEGDNYMTRQPRRQNPVQQQQSNAGGDIPKDTIGVQAPAQQPLEGQSVALTELERARMLKQGAANENVKDVWPPEARMLRAAWEDRLATVKENLQQAKDDLATLKQQKTPSIKDIRETEGLIKRYEELDYSYTEAMRRQDIEAAKGFPGEDINTPEMDKQIEDWHKRQVDADNAITESQRADLVAVMDIIYPDERYGFIANRLEKSGVTEKELSDLVDVGITAGVPGLERAKGILKRELEQDPSNSHSSALLQFIDDLIATVVSRMPQ